MIRLALCGCVLAALPDAQNDGIAAVKKWAQDRRDQAVKDFSGQRLDSPQWDDSVVYQIQVDRFNNGNQSNDGLNPPPCQGDPKELPHWRHGGDLRGIIDRLPYIADLRANTLWVTPVLKHNGEYHGYCTSDPTDVDPGFGSAQDLRELVQEAHKLGIRVVLDIVINHLCDRATSYAGQVDHTKCAQDLWDRDWAGTSGESPSQGSLNFSPGFFPPLRSPHFFNRCGPNSLQEMQGEGPPAVFGDFTDGFFDYDTLNDDFKQIFMDLHLYWIAFADVDGFRLDAAKHVTTDFVAHLSTHSRAFAKTLGKSDFLVIGEVAASAAWEARSLGRMESDPSNPDKRNQQDVPATLTQHMWTLKSTYLGDATYPLPGLGSLYNFEQSGTARDALLLNRDSSDVAKYFDTDDFRTLRDQTLSQKDTNGLWTMLEIHDWPRFLSTQPARQDLLMPALSWLLTGPGVPVIYYGLEQGLNGQCPQNTPKELGGLCGSSDDALKRQDLFFGPWRLGSAVPEVQKMAYVGPQQFSPQPWASDPLLPRDHAVYEIARKLGALRASCPCLRKGSIEWRFAGGHAGALAFSRVLGGQEMLVILQPGGGGPYGVQRLDRDAGVDKGGATYRNVFDLQQTATAGSDQNGAFFSFSNFQVEAGSMAIFANENVLQQDQDLQVALCKPTRAVLV